MYHDFDIPFEWANGSQNYITYHGDIYPGNICFCPNYKEGFFIIPNIRLQTLNSLKPTDRTPEQYRKLGWEIKDRKILPYDPLPSTHSFTQRDTSASQYRDGDDIWKKMFVFGAGASAHCTFGDSLKDFKESMFRPPEGKDLFHSRFNALIDDFPGVQEVIPLFEDKEWEIEACMQEEWEVAMNSYNTKITSRHINIQFYLSHLFRGISDDTFRRYKRGNLYALFALKLQSHLLKTKHVNEKIGIVSFNYDTILDQFLESNFHMSFANMPNYVDWHKNKVVLFKPHGSCNWGWEFQAGKLDANFQNQPQIAQHLYSRQIEPAKIYYELLGDLTNNVYQGAWALEEMVHPQSVGRFTINKNRITTFGAGQDNFFPALLMPYRDKDEFVMPYYHYMAMRTYLDHVEELYLIGWKGNELAFNNQLKDYAKKLKKITIVNPDPETVKQHLSKVLDLKKYEFDTVNTFEEFVRKKLDKILV